MCARAIVVTTTYVRMRVVFCMRVFTVANCSNYGQRRRNKRTMKEAREERRRRERQENEIDFFSRMLTPFFLRVYVLIYIISV